MKTLTLIFMLCAGMVSAQTAAVSMQTPWTESLWSISAQDSFLTLGQYNNVNIATNNLFWTVTTITQPYDTTPLSKFEPALPTNSSSNVYLIPGYLHLALQKQTTSYYGIPYSYTTGAIHSLNSYQYGYFETRCSLPQGNGLWDAFWMQTGQDTIYCNYSELDMFENQGNKHRYTSASSIYQSKTKSCTYTSTPYGPVSNNPLVYDGVSKYDIPYDLTGFHVWGCEWSPNVIIFYLDNVETGRKYVTSDMTINNPMPIKLGLTLNSNYNHTRYKYPLVDNTTPMPSEIVVDYVRVYKLDQTGCGYWHQTLHSASDFASYTPSIKQDIDIGSGVTAPVVVPSISLRASNSITIDKGTSIPLGTDFTAQITHCY